jgi:adenine phosphoribosyltransferase
MQDNVFESLIGIWPNFPRNGVLFKDINPVLRNNEALNYITEKLSEQLVSNQIDMVAAIESRGFIIGSLLAIKLNKGLILMRKAGKLPGPTVSDAYNIEYGSAVMEVQIDAIKAGQRILLADDLIATGGTAIAAANIIQRLGGVIVGFVFVIDIKNLGGTAELAKRGFKVNSLLEYD